MVRKGGVEPPTAFRLPDPKSGASASSATFAWQRSEISTRARQHATPIYCGGMVAMLPSATDERVGSLPWTLSLRRQRQQPAAARSRRRRPLHDPVSHHRAAAARGHHRSQRGRDLPVVRHARSRGLRLVRRRSSNGLRVPAVPSTGVAARRLTARFRPNSTVVAGLLAALWGVSLVPLVGVATANARLLPTWLEKRFARRAPRPPGRGCDAFLSSS